MKPTRPWLAITSILALATGVLLATWLVPTWRTGNRISNIASSDFNTRQAAWAWWRSEKQPLPLAELNASLAAAEPDAFLHGVDALRQLDAWGWEHQPPTLLARHMELLLWRSHVVDIEDAITLIQESPRDAPGATMIQAAHVLLAHPDHDVARNAFHSLVAWAGFRPILDDILDQLPAERETWNQPYLFWLSHGPAPLPIDPVLVVDPNTPGDALHQAWINEQTTEDIILFLHVRQMVMMPDSQQRRRTAVRWLGDLEPGGELETPEHLGPGPERRIAGAMLAAHEHLDVMLLEQAMVIEEDARVRTAMRLAIDVIGPPWNNEDPGEFARHALPSPDGRISLYPLFCRTMAGDLSLLGRLLESAAAGSRQDRFRAIVLVRWFLPGWIGQNTTAHDGDEDQVAIFFDRLVARWRLQNRQVVNSMPTHDDVPHD